MNLKLIIALVLSLWCGLVTGFCADTNSPLSGPTYTWQKGEAIYRDRNHDGKIDLEASEDIGNDSFAIFKVDTNYDGYYDEAYEFGYGIVGKPTTNWSKKIHQRVPVINKKFVPREKPPWMD